MLEIVTGYEERTILKSLNTPEAMYRHAMATAKPRSSVRAALTALTKTFTHRSH